MKVWIILLLTTLIALPLQAAEPAVETRLESLKSEVVALNRELFMLEEDLLFPASTQVSVFVSMDVGEFFALDSVSLKIADQEVAHHLYTRREVDALIRGGVQRLHVGNLKTGEHEVTAVFTGKGTHNRDYRRGATLTIDKGTGPQYVELRIVDKTGKLQPEFEVKQW